MHDYIGTLAKKAHVHKIIIIVQPHCIAQCIITIFTMRRTCVQRGKVIRYDQGWFDAGTKG